VRAAGRFYRPASSGKEMTLSKTIYIEAFENYKKLGLDPLPIPYENGHPTKGPKIAGWQTKAANGEYTEGDFADPCNIGILLGGPRNLTDIDCDSPEAVLIGNEVIKTLPPTFTFGRASKPRSHYIFFCDKSLATEKVTDPVDGECIIEYRCMKQDGDRGHQTVFPPSLRYDTKTGEVEEIDLEDDSAAQPAFIEPELCTQRAFRTAVALG
jgi:Bifunctional DNA primase/polymerase, N-terminal